MTGVFCTICNRLIFPIMLFFRFPLLLTHGQLRMVSVLIFGHSHLLAYYVLSFVTPSSIAVRCSIIVDSISSSFVVRGMKSHMFYAHWILKTRRSENIASSTIS
ncbi:hypothetical protein M405DRAFT_310158 [Rhizopogon salebrosus TDB-379]|nr:hypothetical protein M405DRAFT_310158 [Rhizopogon salebrosus TDB-379]